MSKNDQGNHADDMPKLLKKWHHNKNKKYSENVHQDGVNEGKKASSQISEIESETEKDSQSQSQNGHEAPRDATSSSVNEKQKSHSTPSHKIKGIFVTLIGLGMLIAIGFFLWNRLNRPVTLANFLPADTTMAFAEIDIDPNSSQVQQFFRLFKNYPAYQKTNLLTVLKNIVPFEYQDLQPWLGRQIGIAFLQNTQKQGTIEQIAFIETKDKTKALAFFRNYARQNFEQDEENAAAPTPGQELTTENYKGYSLYTMPKNGAFTFIGDYVILGENANLLQELIDAQTSKNKLRDDPNYLKIADNLPDGGLVFAYSHLPKFYNNFQENPLISNGKKTSFDQFLPLLQIFSAEGMTVFATEKQLQIQTFNSIDRTQKVLVNSPQPNSSNTTEASSSPNSGTYLTYNDRYEGKLLEIANENPLMLIGGHDLAKEFDRIEAVFKANGQDSAFFFEDLVNEQKNKYFGSNISLKDDLEPLLKNEYLLEIDQSFENPQITLFLALSDKNIDQQRIEKALQAFANQSGIFDPQTQEVTLPDGTKGQEIIAGSEQIITSNLPYQNTDITALKLGNLKWSLYYAFIDNVFVISTNPDNIQKSLDRKAGRLATNLTTSDFYKNDFLPILSSADEIFHVKIGGLTEYTGADQNPLLKAYLQPFVSFTMTNNYFDDGISTLYTIDIL